MCPLMFGGTVSREDERIGIRDKGTQQERSRVLEDSEYLPTTAPHWRRDNRAQVLMPSHTPSSCTTCNLHGLFWGLGTRSHPLHMGTEALPLPDPFFFGIF